MDVQPEGGPKQRDAANGDDDDDIDLEGYLQEMEDSSDGVSPAIRAVHVVLMKLGRGSCCAYFKI